VVRVREQAVLDLRAPLAGRPPQTRAREATEALNHVLEQPGPDVVHLEPGERGVTLRVGTVPILELSADDAREGGATDLTLYAFAVGQRIEAALKAERRRLEIQDSVFSGGSPRSSAPRWWPTASASRRSGWATWRWRAGGW